MKLIYPRDVPLDLEDRRRLVRQLAQPPPTVIHRRPEPVDRRLDRLASAAALAGRSESHPWKRLGRSQENRPSGNGKTVERTNRGDQEALSERKRRISFLAFALG